MRTLHFVSRSTPSIYMIRLIFVCWLATVLGWADVSLAQDGPSTGSPTGVLLPADDPLWDLTAPLLVRGGARALPWTTAPLTDRHMRSLVAVGTGGWASALNHFLPDSTSGAPSWGIRVRAEGRATPNARLDPLRPDHPSDGAIYQTVQYESWLHLDNWTAAFGWRHDGFYDRDPDGLDAALRWIIRPENTYLRYSSRYVDAMLGRVVQHWGAPAGVGLLLSDNPRPMDHVSIRFGTDAIALRSSINELDSSTSDGRFTGIAGDDSVSTGSDRRYLAAHRVDVRLNRDWTVALMHSILYSGPNAGLSLKFVNPFNVALFSVDNRPKNDENNGFLGAEVRRSGDRSLFMLQFMLDDIDILNGTEPPSVAATGLLEYATSASTTVGVRSTLVTARAYNALQAEGKYLYLLRGLGTQYSDNVHVGVHVEHLLMPRMWLVRMRVGLDALWQGEGDMRARFPDTDTPALLTGTVRSVVRPYVQVLSAHPGGLYARVDAGVGHGSLVHANGTTGTRLTGSVSVGYRMRWSGALAP